ncbi:MAG: NUDIX hydrolase [Fusobacteriota bacterium]
MKRDIYKGKVLNLILDKEIEINGIKFNPEIIEVNNGVSILVVEDDMIYIAKQHRYGTGGITYELPGGAIDKGETPELAAKRELEEEMGLKAESLKFLFKTYPSPAWDNHYVSVFLAKNIKKVEQKLDLEESIEIIKVNIDEFIKKVLDGKIKVDSSTLAAIYYLKDIKRGD